MEIRKTILKISLAIVLLLSLTIVPAVSNVFANPDTLILRPSGVGSETSIPIQVPDSGAHWEKVDEVSTDEASTYVKNSYDGSNPKRDLYEISDYTTEWGTINSITVYFRTYGYQGKAAASIKSNSTVTDGTIQGTSAAWVTKSEVWNNNPADSEAWQWSDINALEIGVSLSGYALGRICQVTQVWAVIDYTQEGIPPPADFLASDNLTDKVTVTWTKSVGATKYQVYRDGAPIGGVLGDVDTWDDNTAGAPSITPGNAVATDEDYTDKIVLSLSGTSANNGTTYTYKVQGGDTEGWSGDSNTDSGKRVPGALGYQWQKSDGDADNSYNPIGGANSSTYNDSAAPSPTITPGNAVATDGTYGNKVALSLAGESLNDGAGRYYKCDLTATGAANQTSGSNRGYTGGGSLSYQWEADRGAGWGNIGGATDSTYDDTDSPAGTITPGVASASDGTSAAHITLSLAGEGLNDGDTNNYRCELSSADASDQTSGTNTGFRRPTDITYQWYRSAADSDGGFGVLGGATTDPYNDITSPSNGDGRWYYSKVDATGAAAVYSNHDRGYRAAPPVVDTTISSGFGTTWAILNGTVTSAGEAVVTEIGFDYGLTEEYGNSVVVSGSWTSGDLFSLRVDDLSMGSNYHYQAKAYNGAWGYGRDWVFSTEGSLSLYEHLNEGNDGDSGDIYSNQWEAQQFTVTAGAHSVDSVWLYLKRTGDPGTVTVSIRHADNAHEPTGLDLATATVNGDNLSTAYNWWGFSFDEISLEGNAEYAIVVRAIAGDDANDIQWASDTGGGLADAVSFASTDGGSSWTEDAGGADYLFELWGEPLMNILGAQVFSGYLEENDLLFTFHYENTFRPYYPDEVPFQYFDIQLLGTDGVTLIASTVCQAWGSKPGAIYLSADEAAGLTIDAPYFVRLYGSFADNPSASYVLQAIDWRGDNLTYLDNYILTMAHTIANYYDTTFTTYTGTNEVLNDEGAIIFGIGIPTLQLVRPDLFLSGAQIPGYQPEEWTDAFDNATAWEAQVGPQVVTMLSAGGDFFGLTGKDFGAFLILLAYVILAASAAYIKADSSVIIGLALPLIVLGAWLRLIDIVILAAVGAVALFLFIYSFFWSRTS